jgi:hypothetical protein
MSAEDNLSKELFHGTHVRFKKGDVITPQDRPIAWATTDKDHAQAMADIRGEENNTKGRVYSVEPVDPEEMSNTSSNSGELPLDSVVSKKGFKIVGRA